MSRIELKGNISGTGTVTIESPNTNADSTITLPSGGGQMVAVDPGTAGNVVTSNGTAWVSQAIPPSDNASNITTGILAVAYGGTGSNTATFSGANITSLNASSISSGTLSNDRLSTISVAKGGTGATTLTSNNVILGNGTSAVQFVAPGTSGNVLTSNGTTWASAALPASGLQLDTNTSSGATSYAIGQYIMTLGAGGALNSSYAVYTRTGAFGFSIVQESGFSSVSGTWRSRGAINVNGTSFSVFVGGEGLRGSQGSVGIVQRTA